MIDRMDCSTARELAPEFVLGSLDEETAAAVRAHLATCPEAHEEIAELGGTLASLARSLDPVNPRDELRGRLLAAARASRPVSLLTERAVPPSVTGPAPGRSVLQWLRMPRLAGSLATVATAAAILLAATSLTLRSELDETRRTADALRALVAAAARPGAEVARLQGTAEAPGVAGIAVVEPQGGALVLEGLPKAPADAYYEAWYLSGGVARSAGRVDVASDGTGVLSGLADRGPIDQMAVTLEPVSGTPGPDGPIYASGAISANPG
jgi:hypothetical protein